MSGDLVRGEQEIKQLGAAMLHQLDLNKGKGNWKEQKKLEPNLPLTHADRIWDIFYHLIKLALASREDPVDPIRLQEYVADVANCAMIAGDCYGVLDAIFMSNGHSVTHEEDFEVLHEFSLDVIDLLKEYKVLPNDWVDDLPVSEDPRKKK